MGVSQIKGSNGGFMKRYVAIGLVIGILIGCGISYVYFSVLEPILKLKYGQNVQVGIFYYAWYDQGLGERYWGESVEHTVVDKPVLDWYDSQSEVVIQKHFEWLRELRVDFILASWWGPSRYEDSSIQKIFQTLASWGNASAYPKIALLIEPFNETANGYNFNEIYSYINESYVSKYQQIYFNYQNKPLVCYFNQPCLTPNGQIPEDAQFLSIIVGHHYEDYCVDWAFEHITPHWRGPVPHNRTYSVCPRYDDSRLNRSPYYVIDPNYTQQIYDREWRNALSFAEENKIDWILINSWNEFNERSMIEPHRDATTSVDDFFLYNATKQYINELKT